MPLALVPAQTEADRFATQAEGGANDGHTKHNLPTLGDEKGN